MLTLGIFIFPCTDRLTLGCWPAYRHPMIFHLSPLPKQRAWYMVGTYPPYGYEPRREMMAKELTPPGIT